MLLPGQHSAMNLSGSFPRDMTRRQAKQENGCPEEKQRIAIARMILKNAPVVIMDEATAFTDPENEDKIQRSISALTKGKTLLVIAHRLSTIRNADNIVVLKNGRIEAQENRKNFWKPVLCTGRCGRPISGERLGGFCERKLWS